METDHSTTSDAEESNKDSVELNVFSAFLANDGFNEGSADSISLLSDVAQSEAVAFLARTQAKGKGKNLPPKPPFKPCNKFDRD